MKTETKGEARQNSTLNRAARYRVGMLMLACLAAFQLRAATVAIYTNNFEAYTAVATSEADTADADPTGPEWTIVDDTALIPTTAGAGVQVIDWLTNSSGGTTKSLLLRPSSEALVNLRGARSGSRYQLDFWVNIARGPTSSQSFLVVLRGEGADINADDFLAYRTDRVTNSTALLYFDAVGPNQNNGGGWTNVGAAHAVFQWQHHRIVIDPNAQTFSLYLDDMNTAVFTSGELSRCEVPVPTGLRIVNEGNSADDGYYAIDDISLTVEDSRDLATTFTDGFEGYPARVNPDDDADPQAPWVTTEVDGTGQARLRAPIKVQVVDSSVVAPHSGTKCLKLEYGQRAGASVAWGVPPLSDVQVTWWARVPASVQGTIGNYLRMSLYGAEGGNTIAGDSALLGYGSRDATIGDATSITYFTTLWVDTTVDYTPDTWEEYRMITHNSQGRYTVIKNPSGANPQVVVDRAAFVGAAANWGPTFMAAWSSSNGTNHPPVYIDDIEVKSLVSNPDPLADPYTITNYGTRFTNMTVLKVNGPAGKTAVDPRDNSTILFHVDAAPGGIYRARKVASGNWSVDAQPLVSGLDRPSGLVVSTNGTIWWTHDFTQSIRRLRSPWESNAVEEVVSFFGDTTIDDDPIDLTIAPNTFAGALGLPGMVVVADRGSDGDPNNALNLLNPATTDLLQTNSTFLVTPTGSGLGGGNLNAITTRPQSGEVVTVTTDGFIAAVNGDGAIRQIIPNILWTNFFSGGPAPAANGIAADPTTGRLWISDDTLDEVWSVDANSGTQTADQREIGFLLTDVSRPDLQMDFHDPGLAFAPNGDFAIIEDTSVANGGGRLIILHNEAVSIPSFNITTTARVGQGFQLSWESAGSTKYRVQRGTNLTSFVDITGDLTVTQFTDTNVTGSAFYRVLAKP